MSPMFPLIEVLYQIYIVWVTDQVIQVHLTYSHGYVPNMLLVHLLCVCVPYKYSINLIHYEV